MGFRITLLFLFSLSRVQGISQLNESDTMKFQLRAGVTGNYQQGNVNILTIRGRLEFSLTPFKDIAVKSQNSSLYQEFSSRKADNDIYSRNYFYYRPQSDLYPFAIAYLSSNFRRKVRSRVFAGAGLTWQLLKKKDHVLKISGSIVYESTRFNGSVFNKPEYNGNTKINLSRGTLYLAGRSYLLKNHLRLYYDAYWQPAFTNKNNSRTQVDLNADFPIWKGLNFSLLYTFTKENVVISQVKSIDRMLTFGLSYNFKK